MCRAVAPQLRPLLPARLHRSASTAAPHLHPLQLLLTAYVPFSCCSRLRRFNCSPIASASAAAPRLRPLQLLLPDCVHFSCCSPIVSASTAAPRLRPLRLLLSDCVHFGCCSPIASTSTTAPRLHPLRLLLPTSCSGRFQPMPNVFFAEFEVQ